MKKMLIVADYYLPGFKAGGPIKSINLIIKNLSKKYKIHLITRNYDLGDKKKYENIPFDYPVNFSNYVVTYLSKINMYALYMNINKYSPDIIYLNSFFSSISIYIIVLKKLGFINNRIIISTRGELSKGALSLKFFKKKIYLMISNVFKLYNKIDFHVTSDQEELDSKCMVDFNKVFNIYNFIDNIGDDCTIIKKNKDKVKLVFLSRISKKKNLKYCFNILKNCKFSGEIVFDIYGTIEDEKYFNSCMKESKFIPSNIQVKYLGLVNSKKVANVLCKYHMFFLPTLNENFGHVIVESMQLGVIPLISDQTPWINLNDQKVGYSIPLNDQAAYVKAINDVLNFDNEKFTLMSCRVKHYIQNKFDNNHLKNLYVKMCNN